MAALLKKNNELGQVWTPNDIALEMARECLRLNPRIKRVLDPACGPGTFSQALHNAGADDIMLSCYDVDERMRKITASLNKKYGFKGGVHLKDYLTETNLRESFDLVIMNPPYIRHEEIPLESKNKYHRHLSEAFGSSIDRRSNLFALFLLKAIVDLAPGGVLCAIVYDAVAQAGYGKKILEILERYAVPVSSKHVQTPFDGILVDAKILVYVKREMPLSINNCNEASLEIGGFVRLGELLETRRGTGLPLRKLFMAGKSDPYFESSEPFFVKQSRLPGLVVRHDQRAYLYKDFSNVKAGLNDWLKKRACELRRENAKLTISGVAGPIVFNYYIRNAARHLWNAENVAVADNFYVSAPKGEFPAEVAWLLLNSAPYLSRLVFAARSQGNGLSKLQLYEYKNVRVPDWRNLSDDVISSLKDVSLGLIRNESNYEFVRNAADNAIKGLFDV